MSSPAQTIHCHAEAPLPPDLRAQGQRAALRANLFTGFISQVIFGALMMLYGSDVLGYSPVQVGFIASVAPLGMLARFFTLHRVRKTGKVRVIQRSQVTRMVIIAVLLAIPARWMTFPLFTLLICSFILSNELGTGVAWQPVLRDITTTADRGSFFARMRFAFMLVTTAITSVVPLLIGEHMREWHYKCLLVLAMAGSANFYFWCGRIPETAAREEPAGPSAVPLWPRLKTVLARSPLLRAPLVVTLLATMMAFPVFVIYLKEVLRFPSNLISVYIFAVNSGAALSLLVWGRVADAVGFRPMYAGLLVITIAVQPLLFLLTPPAAGWTGPWGAREAVTLGCLLLQGFMGGALGAGSGIALTSIQHYCVHPEDVIESMTLYSAAVLLLSSLVSLATGWFLEHVATPAGMVVAASGWLSWDPVKLWIVIANGILGLAILRLLRRIPNSHADREIGDFFDTLLGTIGQSVKALPAPAWLIRRTLDNPAPGDPEP